MTFVYVGTYTHMGPPSGSKGIYAFAADKVTGRLTGIATESRCINPSYVACPGNGCLYAASEQVGSAAAYAYKIDPKTGELIFLNSMDSVGSCMCHIAVDSECRFLFATHYMSGNITVFSLNHDGSLDRMIHNFQHRGSSINPKRQEAQHAHSVRLSPDEKMVYAADLGMDKIMLYRLDKEKGAVTPNSELPFVSVSPGEGPRHFVLHPNGRFIYLTTEMGGKVIVFDYFPNTGALVQKQIVNTLPEGYEGINLSADIHISADGKYLYVSNRGHDSIIQYDVNHDTGVLSGGTYTPAFGCWPRSFAIAPDGRTLLVANQKSDNLAVCALDPQTGKVGTKIQDIGIPQPVCISFFEA